MDLRHSTLTAAFIGLAVLACSVFGARPAEALPLHPCLEVGAACSLRAIATAAGVRIGAAAGSDKLSDPLYGPTLAREFNSVTAENHMKWPAIHPAEATYDFAPSDALVAFAEANDMTMRGHTLLWANPIRIPGWVNAAPDAETLRGWLESHIETVVTRYAGTVDSWDVVNEPLDNFSSELYDNVFLDLLGEDYIAEAFRIAHAADPTAELFLNEVLVENPHARFDAFYDLVAGLVADGVPIHGVGLQGHIVAGIIQPDGLGLREVIQAFGDLGLVVEITEFDVVMSANGAEALEIEAGIYAELLSACFDLEACRGVTFWGFTDRYSWIDGTFGPGRVPLPFDEDYLPKPAYQATRQALLDRLAAVPEPSGLALAATLAAAVAALRRRSPNRRCRWPHGSRRRR